MAIEEVVGEIAPILPVEVADKILNLVVVLKAVGIAAIVYFVYMVVMGILNYYRTKKVLALEKVASGIEKKVNSIDKKLNKILKKS